MSSILLGLATLSNLTGFASGTNFASTEAHLFDVLSSIL